MVGNGTNGTNGHGASYQNGSKTTYVPINGSSSPSPSGKKKWLIGGLVLGALGAIAFKIPSVLPGASTDAAVAKAGLPKSKSGKLKLFDEHREY